MRGPKANDRRFPLPRRTGHADFPHPALARVVFSRKHGARVIRVEHRQISATRNAGARQASGDILFFVDADTLVNAQVIQSASRSIREGAVGGGCVPKFEGWLPLWWRLAF